jgi:hypothetical protein
MMAEFRRQQLLPQLTDSLKSGALWGDSLLQKLGQSVA